MFPHRSRLVGVGLVAVALWGVAASLGAREGVIEAIRNATHRGPAIFGNVERSKSNPSDAMVIAGYALDLSVAWMLQTMVTGDPSPIQADLLEGDPLYLDPAREIGDARAEYFLCYPYAEHFPGYPYIGPTGPDRHRGQTPSPRRPILLRKMVFQAGLDEAYDFHWHINTNRGAIRWEGLQGLTIDSSVSWFVERLGPGHLDQIGLIDTNLLFTAFFQPWGRVRAGFGSNFLEDGKNSTRGVNFTVLADFYPVEPLVLTAELDFGTVGQAFMYHERYTIGLMVDRFELALGWDQLRIDDALIRGPLGACIIYF